MRKRKTGRSANGFLAPALLSRLPPPPHLLLLLLPLAFLPPLLLFNRRNEVALPNAALPFPGPRFLPRPPYTAIFLPLPSPSLISSISSLLLMRPPPLRPPPILPPLLPVHHLPPLFLPPTLPPPPSRLLIHPPTTSQFFPLPLPQLPLLKGSRDDPARILQASRSPFSLRYPSYS